jgi:uncharacterized protein (TIGR00369 family)
VTTRRAESLARFWQERIPFNRECGFVVTQWDDDGVRMEVDDGAALSNGLGSIHGGVIATLIDTVANAAAIPLDDWTADSQIVTVSMTVHYTGAARGHLVADATCARRGRSLTSVQVEVRDTDRALVAHGVVVVKVSAGAVPDPT